MRIAYCLLVHKNPEQVSRLIGRIYSPSDYFYIHKDKRKPSNGWEIMQKFPKENVVFTSKYNLGKGHVSKGGQLYCNNYELVQATLDAMNWCRSFHYDYFIDLSGQCYPIKPISTIKEQLEKNNAAYMEYFQLPSRTHWTWENGGLDRIDFFYITLWKRYIRIRRWNRTLPYNLTPYGGSLYFCIPKRFVEYVLDYVAAHPKIMRFYRYSKIASEMFFQTIIMNSPLRSDVVNDHKRYFHWEGWHPSILREEDLEELLESSKWFAKTFDVDVDKDILDLLDKVVHE